MGMTDEELHAAQPKKDFKFNMYDENTKVEYRDVVVPNWIAADGRWGDVHNALMAAGNRNFATATEKIVQVLERAREFGRMEAESGREPEGVAAFHEALRSKPVESPKFPGLRDFPNKGVEG